MNPMKVLVLGGTGRTGKHLLIEALASGLSVNAIVRDTSKVTVTHPNLTLFAGMPNDPALLDKALEGCDAVFSALNISRRSDWPWAKLRTPPTLLSDVARLLVEKMKGPCGNRLLVVSAWGVRETKADLPGWFRWLIDHSNISFGYQDHERSEEILEQSDLEWTILRPVGLTNGAGRRKIRVSYGSTPKPSLLISRKNVAKFMVKCMAERLHIGERVTISQG